MIEIPLNSKKYPGHVAFISEEDLPVVSAYTWNICVSGDGKWRYAVAFVNGKTVKMHRLLLGLSARRPIVDHVNGNGLDNTRENLRLSTFVLNGANRLKRKTAGMTSKFKGVHRRSCPTYKNKKWFARVMHNKKLVFSKAFATEVEAAEAYNTAARKIFGEHSMQNIIQEQS